MTDRTLSAIEALVVILILSVGFERPKPLLPKIVDVEESERMTSACDAMGGDYDVCTMNEMRRVFLK